MSRFHIQLEVRAVGPNSSGPREAQWFAVRCGDGPVHPVQMRWDEGWLTDLEQLYHHERADEVLSRLGMRLMRLLSSTGWPRQAALIREAYDRGDSVCVSVICDTPIVLRLPWEALPVGDGGLPLAQILSEPIAYSLPGAGVRPRRDVHHPNGGRLVIVSSGGGDARRAGIRAAVSENMARPAQEILDGPNLAALTEALEQGVRRERPVTMLHLVTRVEMRVEGLMVQMGGGGVTAEWVRERELGNVLSRFADTLRVVVLSLTGPPGTDTSGLARELHRAGVAAVVSPRLPLSQDSVVPFVTHLYDALIAQALPLNKALTSTYSRMRSDGLRLDAASHQIFRSPSVSAAIRPFTFAPYKGLAPYRPIDSTRFFGRFAETLKLVDLVSSLTKQGRPRFVLVAGAPHSGRTSLVEAGLYPRFETRCRASNLPDRPLRRSAQSGRHRARGTPQGWCLGAHGGRFPRSSPVVERLDCDGAPVGQSALAPCRIGNQPRHCGRGAARRPAGRMRTHRGDDLGASLENLAYDDRHRLFITEPGPRALREIIDRPAQMVDLAMDAEFATSVMRAAARRPGSLREVSLVLDRAWSLRRNDIIRGIGHSETALLSGAFSRLNDRLRVQFPDETDQAFIGTLVRALVDSTTGAPTPVDAADLVPSAAEARSRFERLVRCMAESGLLEDKRAGDRRWLVLRLPELVPFWSSGERPPAPAPLPAPVRARPRPPRRNSGVAWVAALLLFSASGAGLFGWWGQRSHQRNQADERFEAAERAVGDPTSAAVLLRQIPPMLRPEGWAAAANAALQSAQADKVLHYDGANVQQLAFSSDGSMLLVRVDGEIKLVSTTEGNVPTREIKLDDADGGVVAATFSPSGVKVVTVARSGRVQAWPVAGGVPQDIAPAVEQDAGVVAAFSPRARHLVRVWGTSVQVHDIDGNAIKTSRLSTSRADGASTACCAVVDDAGERWAVGTEEGQILLFERNRKRAKKLRLEGLRRFHLNRGGTHLLALGDGTLRIIDMMRGTGSNRTPASVRVDAAVFSPDGRHIAVDYLDQNTGVRHSRSVSVASRVSAGESGFVGRATALGAVRVEMCCCEPPMVSSVTRHRDGCSDHRVSRTRKPGSRDPAERRRRLVGQLGHRRLGSALASCQGSPVPGLSPAPRAHGGGSPGVHTRRQGRGWRDPRRSLRGGAAGSRRRVGGPRRSARPHAALASGKQRYSPRRGRCARDVACPRRPRRRQLSRALPGCGGRDFPTPRHHACAGWPARCGAPCARSR